MLLVVVEVCTLLDGVEVLVVLVRVELCCVDEGVVELGDKQVLAPAPVDDGTTDVPERLVEPELEPIDDVELVELATLKVEDGLDVAKVLVVLVPEGVNGLLGVLLGALEELNGELVDDDGVEVATDELGDEDVVDEIVELDGASDDVVDELPADDDNEDDDDAVDDCVEELKGVEDTTVEDVRLEEVVVVVDVVVVAVVVVVVDVVVVDVVVVEKGLIVLVLAEQGVQLKPG